MLIDSIKPRAEGVDPRFESSVNNFYLETKMYLIFFIINRILAQLLLTLEGTFIDNMFYKLFI